MFREIEPDLYVVEQPFEFFGLELGARMTIVRRKNDDLWVYAPFKVSPEELAAIKSKGKVRDIVVPNTFHTTQVGDFSRRFSDATVWASPELKSKLSGVPHETLDTMPREWKEDFDGFLFEGAKGFKEWTFFHRPSRTLLITDLGFHVPRQKTARGRIVARLNDVGRRFGPSRLERTLMKLGHKTRERQEIQNILDFDFGRILAGHGLVVEREAKRQFRAAYRFLGV